MPLISICLEKPNIPEKQKLELGRDACGVFSLRTVVFIGRWRQNCTLIQHTQPAFELGWSEMFRASGEHEPICSISYRDH